MKVLLLGANGQLGRSLQEQLNLTDHQTIFASREIIDVIDFEATRNELLTFAPHVVINAAAYTQVDRAEEDFLLARLVNTQAVENIAKICRQIGCWFIHFSTDYVFNGESQLPYKEDDHVNPQGVYGLTKLEGESAIKASGCKHIIVRTSWVFSEFGSNFLKTMLRLGSQRHELSVVADQFGCPTYANDLASAVTKILPRLNDESLGGVFHYCGDSSCSWHDFAHEIFDYARDKEHWDLSVILKPIETVEYPTPAKRPFYSVLDCSKIQREFGIQPSDWRRGLRKIIERLDPSMV